VYWDQTLGSSEAHDKVTVSSERGGEGSG